MRRKKYGFSFIELILILVFFFLILAALMPMVTRRHLAPPARVSHGTYACYYERQPNGEQILKETLVKGKKTILDNQTVDPDVGCRFEAPRKAKYFYVQIIGGGGGGRDLNWAEDVDPENVENYRIKGKKEMSPDDEGFLVQDASDCPSPGLKGFSMSGLGLNFEKYKALVNGHSLILHATSESGHNCADCSASEFDSTGGLNGPCCDRGEFPQAPRCLAQREKSLGACTFAGNEEIEDFKTTNDGYNYLYSYPCKDEDGDYFCDAGECEVPITCNDEPIAFQGESTTIEKSCKNEIGADSGLTAYTEVKLSGWFSGAGISYWQDGDILYTRHCRNHDNCFQNSLYYKDKYFNYTQAMNSATYDKYKNNSTYKFTKNLITLTPGVNRMPNGSGYYFDSKISTWITPLYVCGGQGAERALTLAYNPRSSSGAGFCTPSDAYGGFDLNFENQFGRDAEGYLIGPTILQLFTEAPVKGSPAQKIKNNSKYHDFLSARIIEVNLSQEQVIPYGVGGRAGELKSLILKTVPDGVYMMPGKGGEIGEDGQDSIFGSDADGSAITKKVARGGQAGKEVYAIDAGIGAFKSDKTTRQNNSTFDNSNRIASSKKQDSRYGGTISYSTFVKFIISYQNRELKSRMAVFGIGGNGAYTQTNATCGYDYNAVVFHDSQKDPPIISSVPRTGQTAYDAGTFTRTHNCNGYKWKKIPKPEGVKDIDYDEEVSPTNGYYWGYYENAFSIPEEDGHAQPGQTGAIVISW